MKNWKRFLSTILVLVLCFSLVPAEAFASGDAASGEVSTDALRFEGTTSVGTLITHTIENAGEADSAGAGTVLDVTVSGQSATVSFVTDRASEVVVAIYEDGGIQMLGSGHAFVTAADETVTVSIETETMPQYFWTAVYLLDAESHEPLCEQFISRYYARDFQDLLNSSVDDYDPDRILNLDDRTDTNFAVYSEDVLVTEAGAAVNQVVDSGNGSYVIYQADESFRNLKPGDVFARENRDGTVLIVVARSVEVDGTTVTVYDNPDAELRDVFDYVKIDGDSYGAKVYYDSTESDPSVSLASDYQPQSRFDSASREEGSFSHSTSYSIDSDSNPKITGSVTYGFTVAYQVYLTENWQYVSFSIKNSASISVSVSAELFEKEILLGHVYVITGTGINIDWQLSAVLSVEAEITWTGTLSFTVGAVYDSDSDQRISSLCTKPKLSSELEVTGTISIGLKLEPVFSAISEKMINASISGKAVLVFEVTPRLQDSDDIRHNCVLCEPGTLKAKESVKVGFSILNGVVKKDKTIASFTQKINDFYICFDRHEVGWGTCPYLSYRISMTFLPEGSEFPLANTTVSLRVIPVGETLSHDPNAETIEETVDTDEDGMATIFVPNGSYTFTASSGKYYCADHPLTVKSSGKSITVTMDYGTRVTVVDADGNPVPDAGITVTETQESYQTDENGKAFLPVYNGRYPLVITKDSYRLETVLDGTEAEVTIRLERSFAGASTCITVLDVNGPVSRASVVVTGYTKTYTTNSSGLVYIPLSVGDHEITVSKGSVSETRTIHVDSEDASITITLSSEFPSSIIRGTCGRDAVWALDTETQVLTISGEGAMYNYDKKYSWNYAPWYDYREQIQSIVVENNVTSIGDYAFYICSNAVTASIASSVTTIGKGAFSSCYYLATITIAPGVTSVGESAFDNCQRLKSITLPSGVTELGDYAFNSCFSLASVKLPTGLTSIGERAFYECRCLTNIDIPSGVTIIGREAFGSCSNLASVSLPDGLTSIDRYAFYCCAALQSILLPDTVTSIGERAFCACENLKTIRLSSGLTDIGEEAFWACYSLTGVIQIPSGVTSIPQGTFSECGSITGITLPSSVTSIGPSAFESCSSLTSVNIPSGVPAIEYATFQGCENLTSIDIPPSVTSIGWGAFSGCSSLTDVDIPSGVRSIENDTFYNCSSLRTVSHMDGVTSIGDNAFSGCTSLESIRLPVGLQSIGDNAFRYCYVLAGIDLPSTLTSLGDYAFSDCRSLEHADLPSGLTSVPYGVFSGCSGLARATIPSGVTIVDGWAFRNCSSLKHITLPAGLTTISYGAFSGCSGLTGIDLPAGIITVDDYAFEDCSSLTSAEFQAGLQSIGEFAFENCTSLTSFHLPSGLTSIGRGAFESSGLTEVTVPEGVTTIQSETFWNCDNLQNAQLPRGLTSIGDNAFYSSGLKTLTLPAEVTTIGERAFSYCPLTDVYYGGTSAQWNEITIGSGNEKLTGAKIHFSYTTNETDMSSPTDLKEETLPEENLEDLPDTGDTPPAEAQQPEENPAAAPQEGEVVPKEESDPPAEEAVPEEDGESRPPASEEAVETETSPESETAPQEPFEYDADPVIEEAPAENPGEGSSELIASPLAAYNAGSNDGTMASFYNLVPGESYVLIVAADPAASELLAPANLLYLSQATAASTGSICFAYKTRSGVSGTARAYGAAQKRMSDAEIRIEQLIDDSFRVTVLYDDIILQEGMDYLLILTEDDETVTVSVRGRDKFSGTKTVVGEKLLAAEDVITLSQSYLVMKPDSMPAQLVAVTNPKQYQDAVTWRAEAAEKGGTAPITVDGNGFVSVVSDQNALGYVIASLTVSGKTYFARCRVDVVADDGTETPVANAVEETKTSTVTGVTLPENKGTVELFRTDYLRITVLLNLLQNMPQNSTTAVDSSMLLPEENAEDLGVAITDARFTEDAVAALFDLRVADDRTLEVRPRFETMQAGLNTPKDIKNSYSSPITVFIEGQEFTTPAYTLTVKKTLPKVTAKAVKLNSFLQDTQPLVFEKEKVVGIDEPANQGVLSWLRVDTEKQTVSNLQADRAKHSGKLELKLTLEGWALKIPVTVSVSTASTAPKLTFKPSSLTVRPESGDSATAVATVTPAQFADHEVSFVSITEGKNPVANDEVLRCSVEGNVLTVWAPKYPTDGKAHTYKVNLSVDGVQSAVTVKTIAKTANASLSVKAAGTIDTMIPNSPITLTPSLKNYSNGAGVTFSVEKILREKKGEETVDVTDAFNVTQNGNTLILTAKDVSRLLSGYTYTAKTAADIGTEAPLTATVKVNVKSSAKAPAITATLKASGSIDVIRPESSVTVTPTVKNLYGHMWSESDLVFYRGTGKKAAEITNRNDIPFAVELVDGGYRLRLIKEINDLKAETYSVGLRFNSKDGQAVSTKAPVTVPIKMGTAKLNQSVKTVQLLKNDRYSDAEIRIWSEDTSLSEIGKVRAVEKTGSFAIDKLGNGRYAIHFQGNQVSAAALKAKSMTVKLEVFLKGNNSTKANTTLSLKVELK